MLPKSQVLTINKANPIITFKPIPTQVLGSGPLTLTVTCSSGLPLTLTSTDASVATIINAKVYFNAVGVTTITAYQVGNQNYNQASVSQVLTVISPVLSTLPVVPNGFTPNGDGINDTWEILNLDKYPSCAVKVFNRNGQMVFYSVGYATPWNGRFNNQALPSGSYYYVIDLKNNQDVLSGFVNIIK